MSETARAYSPGPANPHDPEHRPSPVLELAIDHRADADGLPHLVLTTTQFTTSLPVMDIAQLLMTEAVYPDNGTDLVFPQVQDPDERLRPRPHGAAGGPIVMVENISDDETGIATPHLVLRTERQVIYVALATVLEAIDIGIAYCMPTSEADPPNPQTHPRTPRPQQHPSPHPGYGPTGGMHFA